MDTLTARNATLADMVEILRHQRARRLDVIAPAYDREASGAGWDRVVSPACECPRTDLVVYFDHLRQMARELGSGWTPRDVDIALYVLGTQGATPPGT